MAAVLQGAHAFAGAADRLVLRTEVLAVENRVSALRRRPFQRAPRAARQGPAAVGPAERIGALLRAGTAQALVADVLHPFGATRHQHVAHDAVLAHAERGRVDEETEAARVDDAELEQIFGHRIGRQFDLLFASRLQILALPVALYAARGAAAGERER